MLLESEQLRSVLYPYQKEYIADDSRFSIWIASRQIGKSFGASFKLVLKALSGRNQIVMSTSVRNARRIIKTCKKALAISELILGQPIRLDVDNKDELVFANGRSILSIASNPSTAVGDSGDLTIDEASRFKNSDEIMDAVMPFITRGYSLSLISTPLGKRGMFWRYYQKATQEGGNWKLFQHTVHDAVAQGCPIDVELLKQEMDEISFRQNYLCEFIDDVSSYFGYELILKSTNVDLSNYSIEDLLKCNGHLIAGYDPGKMVDSGVFTILERTHQKGKIRVLHIKEFKKVDYSEQIAYLIQYTQAVKIPRVFVDATGVGVKIVEDLKRVLGSIIQPITYTNSVKEQLITDLKLAMERDQIEIPDSARLIDQLHGIQREITNAGNVRYGHDSSRHDDIVLAICNALSGYSRRSFIDLDGILITPSRVLSEL